eukprot:CAMPEP_0172893372 /NCGR_PEP_ID=MMETSP1075-20121228/148307_1 /TAXON_ID=2916 /ORGANISM="Ceratium fusus, Strain PA161109" /LENGTH=116 /DNA_ID=CAMNT_0013748221 /DNA_START=47 /DNA_END=394 /DNA_ORIENTATION=+
MAAACTHGSQWRRPPLCTSLVGISAVLAAVTMAPCLHDRRFPGRLNRQTMARAFACVEDGATDPSLFVSTNVDLGSQKAVFMQAASKAVAKCLKKPESYVAICVQDKMDIIWGGSD